MPGQVDPRQQLANALAPAAPAQILRKGKVTSVNTSGSVFYAYITVDGTNSRARKATWNGNGSQPAVNDYVYYIDQSPTPLIVGRVPTANQNQDFGSGTVTGGDFVDSGGSIRGDLNSHDSSISGLNSSVSSLSSTVSGHTSSINSLNNSVTTLNSTVSSHTTSINSLNNSVTSLNSTVSGHTSSINNLNNAVGSLQTQINSLNNQVSNLISRLAYYESNMDYLARLGAAYSGHTTHPPPAW